MTTTPLTLPVWDLLTRPAAPHRTRLQRRSRTDQSEARIPLPDSPPLHRPLTKLTSSVWNFNVRPHPPGPTHDLLGAFELSGWSDPLLWSPSHAPLERRPLHSPTSTQLIESRNGANRHPFHLTSPLIYIKRIPELLFLLDCLSPLVFACMYDAIVSLWSPLAERGLGDQFAHLDDAHFVTTTSSNFTTFLQQSVAPRPPVTFGRAS